MASQTGTFQCRIINKCLHGSKNPHHRMLEGAANGIMCTKTLDYEFCEDY
jgi:hypothetical protein